MISLKINGTLSTEPSRNKIETSIKVLIKKRQRHNVRIEFFESCIPPAPFAIYNLMYYEHANDPDLLPLFSESEFCNSIIFAQND
jgi:hypothetical protein